MSTTQLRFSFDWQLEPHCLNDAVSHDVKVGSSDVRQHGSPREWKLVSLGVRIPSEHQFLCDSPARAAAYWHKNITTSPYFDTERERFVVVMLNTRNCALGHHIVGIGLLNSVLVHPREVFRVAILAGAYAIVVMHNHPSGDPTPSEADIRTTRDLIRAGQLLRIEVLDHIVVGEDKHTSLRELGYFYS